MNEVLISMDNHINKLVNVCRLCCGKIKLDNYYSRARKVSEYAEEIRIFFVYDTSIDISGVHPLYFVGSL